MSIILQISNKANTGVPMGISVYDFCPFCDELDVSEQHVSNCSLRDAMTKTHDPLRVLGLFIIMTLAKTYDEASLEERSRLYVCHSCGDFDFAETTHGPLSCSVCKSEMVSPVSVYIEEILSS